MERTIEELTLGFNRYQAIRRLTPRQYSELHDRNMKGENFDEMIDALDQTKQNHETDKLHQKWTG